MITRRLGRTDIKITELGYGAMELRKIEMSAADHLLNNLLDKGIGFIDTSPDYGISEEVIGRCVSKRRHEFILASKCGCNIPRTETDSEAHIWTSGQVLHNVERSLRLLKTDYLDLLQIHGAAVEEVRSGKLVETMRQLQTEGKIRHVGYSASGGTAMFGYNDFVQLLAADVFDFFQLPYCVLARIYEESITDATKQNTGVIVRGTVQPQYVRVYEESSWEDIWNKANLDDLLAEGENRYRFMLRFAISHPDFSTIIIGTSDLEHLSENIKSFEIGALSSDVYEEVKQRLDTIGITKHE